MNKNAKRAIIGGITGVAVALGGAWYVVAGNILTSTKSLLDTVNTKQREDGSSIKITYDGLERTMFPNVGVRLVNPAIEVNSPGIADPNADAMTPLKPIHVLWKHTGTIDIITDKLSHEYRLVNDGSGAGSLDSGEDKIALTSAPSHSEMTLKAKNNDAFTQWQSLNLGDQAAVKKALAQIGGAHVAAGPMKVTDTASGAIILTQDEAKFDLVNRSDDAKINFDLALSSKGSQVTKEYSDLALHVLNMLHLPTGSVDGTMPMAASRAGKQDVEIAMNVDLPSAPSGQPTPNGDIHVTKFSISNDFYHVQAPTDVVLHEDASARHAVIKLNWSLDISPAGAKEMQVLLDSGLPRAPAMLGGAGKDVDPEKLKQAIMAALPTVSTLGPITLVLDVDASVPKPGAKDAKPVKESVSLRAFSFSHKRWGIDAKGEAIRDTEARAANINGTLTCKQCTTLTQDLFETAHAVQGVMVLLQPGTAPFPLTEAMLTQLNTTLAEIGKPGANMGDIDFVVTTPAAGDVRLNDKPIGEAMPKLMMVFMPPQSAPAAAEPPPAKQDAVPGAPAI